VKIQTIFQAMARKKAEADATQPMFRDHTGQVDFLQKSLEEELMAKGPVECLGMTFENDKERRAHFLEKLREKLKDPEFRKIAGFPIGDDEDILALSDPPYYTACPNPWIIDFVNSSGKRYDPEQPYHREPFAADVSEGKAHPIYNAHTYHTKVPHRAIMRYILHYTEPGDLVLDAFSGTGMTGVAAQLCGDRAEVKSLGHKVQDDGTIIDQVGIPCSKLGTRRTILNDLSPAAAFIAFNYNTPFDFDSFTREANQVLKEVESEYGWMYETKHNDGKTKGRINYTVWSDIFSCPECAEEVVFWEEAVKEGEVQDDLHCPRCNTLLRKRDLERTMVTRVDAVTKTPLTKAKRKPVLINYTVGTHRYEKKPDNADLALIERIENTPCHQWFPTNRLEPDTDLWLERDYRSLGMFTVDAFYTRRNLIMAAFCREAIMRRNGRTRGILWFWFQSVLMGFSLVNRYLQNAFSQVNRILSGTLYVGAMQSEVSPWYALTGKMKRLRVLSAIRRYNSIVGTASAIETRCPDNSIDYIFIDPPFGSNIIYSDLSLLWESWLKLSTKLDSEAVVHRRKEKGALSLSGYAHLMRQSFQELHRILKPGRWITIEFHNTQNSVWNSIQIALQEAGFVVTNVAALDKQMRTFKAVTTTTATKQDLVISAYKPNGGLEERFSKRGGTEEGVWDFLRTHLRNLPVVKSSSNRLEFITERDPRILYDRMVAFYVSHSTAVPLSSAEFQNGLIRRFPERDGMYFLSEQVAEYDKKRMTVKEVLQLEIFITDEASAIEWLRQQLIRRTQTLQEINPMFMRELGGWHKHEKPLELVELLGQNFLCYDGEGEVPSQIHSYLSTNFKECRKLAKDDPALQDKAKDRWYVPDPNRAGDLEKLRDRALLREFWEYLPSGYAPTKSESAEGYIPGMEPKPGALPRGKKMKIIRMEAVRAGFKHCWQSRDYRTIIAVAQRIPEDVLQEDPKLLMWYDQALTRTGQQ
jgi:DNA modification methylase